MGCLLQAKSTLLPATALARQSGYNELEKIIELSIVSANGD
jgi:hypothetical protein